MKRWISGLLALMLALALGHTALAGEGDRALAILTSDDSYYSGSLENVLMMDGKIYLFINGMNAELRVFDPASGETVSYDMQEMEDRMNGLTLDAVETGSEEGEAQEEPGLIYHTYENALCWFPMEGEIYAVTNRVTYREEGNQVDGGHVRKLILQDGKADLAAEDTLKLDWEGMTYTYGSWTEIKYPNSTVASGNRLYMLTYDNEGEQSLEIFDLTTGEMTGQSVQDWNDIAPSEDGRLMVAQYRWGEQAEQVISLYDSDSESLEPLYRFSLENSGNVNSIAYQPETDTLFFARDGEIYRAKGGDVSQAEVVNDCPVSSGRSFAQLTEQGQMLVWNYNGAFLRNTDPALRSEVTLRVRPYTWSRNLDNASFLFASEHNDIALVRESYGNESTLLQSMMNRDSDVDVYLMSMESSAFGALFDRGFLLDLSGSEALTSAVDSLYPFVGEAVKKDGKLLAIPIGVSGYTMGYQPKNLEAVGLTAEDMPTTWEGMMDFLEELPSRLSGKEARAFELYTDRSSIRSILLRSLLAQYSLTHDGEPMNTPVLRNLLERIQKINFDALDVLSEEDMMRMEEENLYEEWGGSKPSLLETYANIPMESYAGASQPLALGLMEGEEPVLPLSMSVAFVNPYSQHPEAAIAFLETLMAHMDFETRYTLNPNMNDPVRYPNHEEQKKNIEKYYQSAKTNLEKATASGDEEEMENWTEIVQNYEETLRDFDQNNWMVSPEGIERYRERAKYIQIQRWNYLDTLYSGENGEQYWGLQQGFLDGTTSAGDLLSFIDKKVQMMRLEGN